MIQLIQSHTTDTEVKNIIMTGAEALIEQGIEQGIERGAREMSVHNIFTVLSELSIIVNSKNKYTLSNSGRCGFLTAP